MPMYRSSLLAQLSSAFSRSNTPKKSKQTRRTKVHQAARQVTEALESRLMMYNVTTTVQTPASLTFKSIRQTYNAPFVTGHFITISQSGNTTASYQGAYLDDTGNIQLTPLPAVNTNGTAFNGGLGGQGGTQLYGQVVYGPDPQTATDFRLFNPLGTTALRMNAIATRPFVQGLNEQGIVYGLNVAKTANGAPLIQLIRFGNSNLLTKTTDGSQYSNTFFQPQGLDANGNPIPNVTPRGDGTLIEDINLAGLLTPDGATAVTVASVPAAAFNPVDGRMYFVVQGSGPNNFYNLFAVDVDTGVVTQMNHIAGGDRFGAVATIPANPVTGSVAVPGITEAVSAIAFDQTGPTTANMYAVVVETAPQAATAQNPLGTPGAPVGYLGVYPFAGATVDASTRPTQNTLNIVTNGVGNTTQLTGLTLAGSTTYNPASSTTPNNSDDPTKAETYIYATTAAGNANAGLPKLYRFNLQTFNGIDISDLPNPNAGGSTLTLGSDIQDIAWDTQAYDPILDFNQNGGLINPGHPSGAFVGTDAKSNELAVISISPRPSGLYLYNIVVSAGDPITSDIAVGAPAINGYNIVTGVPDVNSYSGSIDATQSDSGDISVQPGIVRAPANSGIAYLGLKAAGLRPITSASLAGTPLSYLNPGAGFYTAPGVSINRFQFAGTVTGNVSFGGSAQVFAAGWLISGDNTGGVAAGSSEFILSVNGNPGPGGYSLVATTSIGASGGTGLTEITPSLPNLPYALNYNSSAAQIQAALNNIPIVRSGGANAVQVTPLGINSYLVNFSANIGITNLSSGFTTVPGVVSITSYIPPGGVTATNDLRNVFVQTDAGGGGISEPSGVPSTYNTNLQVTVGGHMDQFRTVGDLTGNLLAQSTANGIDSANAFSNSGFGFSQNWNLTPSANTSAGRPSISTDVLTLTSDPTTPSGSAFYTASLPYLNGFEAKFTYTGNNTSSGAAFILQNSAAGTSALGDGGGWLGYTTTASAAAAAAQNPPGFVPANQAANDHSVALGWTVAGSSLIEGGQADPTAVNKVAVFNPATGTGDVALNSGHPIDFVITGTGDSRILYYTLTDEVTKATFSSSVTLTNTLRLILGGNTALVGFSGAAGNGTTPQTISGFLYSTTGDIQHKLFTVDPTRTYNDGWLTGSTIFTNTTFDTPQYLGVLSNSKQVVTLEGTLEGQFNLPAITDKVDYYAVSLLAGQTVTAQLLEPAAPTTLHLGIFDPDGRLIATDYSNVRGSGVYTDPTTSQPFQFTADRPGNYRFAVAYTDDPTFLAPLPLQTTTEIPTQYVLHVGLTLTNTTDGTLFTDAATGAPLMSGSPGNISLGGVFAGNYSSGSVTALNGDLGGTHADGVIGAFAIDNVTPLAAVSFNASSGSLRDVDAPGVALFYKVENGSIGLLRATNPLGALSIDSSEFDHRDDALNHAPKDPVTGLYYLPDVVGGDVQIIDATGTLEARIAANHAIGTVRSGNQALGAILSNNGTPASANTFAVNPNNNPTIEGRIDLIDCTGDFGNVAQGGPHITTGPGGDVAFINVGGTVYEDNYFGGGSPVATIHDPGQAVTIIDDGGGSITLTPIGAVTANPAYNASSPVVGVPATLGPALTVSTYGIRGSGGSVILNATVNGGGLDINANGPAANRITEVTNISLLNTGAGPTVINTPATQTTTGTANSSNPSIVGPFLSAEAPEGGNTAPSTGINAIELDPASTNSLVLTIEGNNNVDIFNITGGNFTSITNSTTGEIVNINATSIGLLQSNGPIGVPTHNTAADLDPVAVVANVYPFLQQHYGIVSGSIVQVSSQSSVGNFVVTGDIGSIVADSTHLTSPRGMYAGIDGPIFATGQIQSVDIGQGILSSGSGNLSRAGIYANGIVGLVTNSRPGAEIRGTVMSLTQVNAVTLSNASIVHGVIAVLTSFPQAEQIQDPNVLTYTNLVGTFEKPIFSIGQITIHGTGGIVGSLVAADTIGPINVTQNAYGILFSDFYARSGNGQIATVKASGYGIRGTFFSGGSSMAGLNATGNGSAISTSTYFTADPALFVSRSATPSLMVFDPYSGLLPGRLTDIDAMLGTSTTNQNINTDTGVIEDTIAVGSRTLGSVDAFTIRAVAQTDNFGALLLPNPNTALTTTPGAGGFGTEFNFGNSISAVRVRGAINGLEITTGKLGTFSAGSTIYRSGITVSGTISNMVIRGDYGNPVYDNTDSKLLSSPQVAKGDSFIQAVGPHGVIKNLTILGSLYGSVLADGSIGKLTISKDVIGNIQTRGKVRGLALGVLRIGGALVSGSLNINGSAGTIQTTGGLGSIGDPGLTITGNLNQLIVGQPGALNSILALPIHVTGSVGTIVVNGRIQAAMQIDGSLKSLQVTGDGTTASIVNSPITVNHTIGKILIANGNLTSNILANGTIKLVTFDHGSINANSSVTSANGSISSLVVSGGLPYGVFGAVTATKGQKEKVNISGSLGDGTNAASITAASGSTFHIGGSISNAATLQVAHLLNLLQVDGNIEAGAVVSAHPLKKQIIGGVNFGTVTTV